MPRNIKTCSIHAPPSSVLTQDPFHNSRVITKFDGSFVPFVITARKVPSFDYSPFDERQINEKRKIKPKGLSEFGTARFDGVTGFETQPTSTPVFDFGNLFWCTEGGLKKQFGLADQLRWKNAFRTYEELDTWNLGYIDIHDIAGRLQRHPKKNLTHVERLVSILEDLRPYVSSRGVVERDVAIVAIKRAIDETGLSCPVYGPLRGAGTAVSSRIHSALNKKLELGTKPFYQGAYAAKGLQGWMTNEANWTHYSDGVDVTPQQLCRPKLERLKKPQVVPEGTWGPIDAPLEVHSQISKEKREKKIEKIREEEEKKEKEACTFKATLTKPLSKSKEKHLKSPTRSKAEYDLNEALILVAPQRIVLCSEEPSEGQEQGAAEETYKETKGIIHQIKEPLQFQQCRAKRRLENKQIIEANLTHFVLHSGEPPALKAVPWEESLRTDWERRVFNTRLYSDGSFGCGDSAEAGEELFDAFSQKIHGASLERGLFVTGPNWTPKMAFEHERSEALVPPSEAYFTATIPGFSAPYNASYFGNLKRTDPVSRADRASNKDKNERQTNTKMLSVTKGQQLLPLLARTSPERPSISSDTLLLPQTTNLKKTNDAQKTVCGELESGIIHRNRGHSEWVYNLRK